MNLRKINRVVHRDLGYFFFGMTIIYGLSGIALNHRHDWNPNYSITQKNHLFELPGQTLSDNKDLSLFFLGQLEGIDDYRTQLLRGKDLRIFVRDGSIDIDLETGVGKVEIVRKRPVFYEVNFLHYNTPKKLWTWFSDLFAGGLIILAITGLFVLKGKQGITQRGAWITAAGVVLPLLLLYIYL